MAEENKNLEINPEDTFENEDIKTLQAMEAKYNAELAKRDQKYSALLKYATEGGKVSTETTPEPTPEEKWKANCDIIRNRDKYDNLTIAKALKEGDDYYREKFGKSIFVSETGTPDSREEKIADIANEIISYGIENSYGDNIAYTNAALTRLQ